MSCVRCHRKEGSPLSFAWLLVNECHSSRYQSFGVFLFILSGGSGFWWFQHSVVLQIYHTSTCLNLTSKGITETPFWAYFPGIHSNLNVESNRLTKGSIGSTLKIWRVAKTFALPESPKDLPKNPQTSRTVFSSNMQEQALSKVS